MKTERKYPEPNRIVFYILFGVFRILNLVRTEFGPASEGHPRELAAPAARSAPPGARPSSSPAFASTHRCRAARCRSAAPPPPAPLCSAPPSPTHAPPAAALLCPLDVPALLSLSLPSLLPPLSRSLFLASLTERMGMRMMMTDAFAMAFNVVPQATSHEPVGRRHLTPWAPRVTDSVFLSFHRKNYDM